MLKMWLKCNLRSKAEYGFTVTIFMKVTSAQRHYMEMSYGDAHGESSSVSNTTAA